MPNDIILASGSQTRFDMLTNAGVPFQAMKPMVDEETIKSSLRAENAPPRDIADTLAEYKARKLGQKYPDAYVIGSDQVLAFKGETFDKPTSPDNAIAQLQTLRGETHQLLSAAVIYHGGEPIWRHVGVVRLTMRDFSDDYLTDYVARNWQAIQHSVGSYQIEKEGARLFARLQGDHFSILGLPLIELLSYLTQREVLAG